MERVVLKSKRGRPPRGTGKKAEAMAKRAALLTGTLPHMLLLEWAVTGFMDGEELSTMMRLDACKAAANYFAPRLVSSKIDGRVSIDDSGQSIEDLRKQIVTDAIELGLMPEQALSLTKTIGVSNGKNHD